MVPGLPPGINDMKKKGVQAVRKGGCVWRI